MKLATTFATLASVAIVGFAATAAHSTIEEHVTGGVLDLVWVPGFDVVNNLEPLTLTPADPAYANPSGDHTVGAFFNAVPDSGGIALPGTDPQGASDYIWEAWIFTGSGDSRRGLVVRADPSNDFASCYQFVIQAGLLQMNFRKLVDGVPTTLGTWFTTSTPGGLPSTNTWHHMKVIAEGSSFRCFWDEFELTASPIVDSDHATGWVGVYNFRFDVSGIRVLVDDLVLTPTLVNVQQKSWTGIKNLYKNH